MENTRYKILLIEDNELDQRAFKRFVDNSDIPYDCTIASSVSEANGILNSDQFDAIISDHSLGDGTAFDILDLAKDTPTIVVTGAGDEETAVKAWKAGAYDYLIKDLDLNYLKAIPITVENAIRHKIVEKKLQLLSGAVMSTDDSVYITDMESRIIFINKAFCETYGYKEEEIVGKSGSILWIGKNQSESTRSVFQTQGAGSTCEVGFYHKRKDDSIFPVSLSRSTIRDSRGKDVAIVGVARDISERILIEDEFKTTTLKLKKRNQLKNEIAITVTEALLGLLADEKTDQAKKVISDYLDISKIEAGRLEIERSTFSFATVVSQIFETLLPTAEQKNIQLKYFIPEYTLNVNGDRDRIEQVLSNLVSRAIEISPPNGHITVRVRYVGGEIAVEIQDEGAPLERDQIHSIVNRHDWIKEQFRSGREDLALGLWIAKELVEMHGGRIWAESLDSERNNFCFTVPKSGVRKEVPVEVSSASAS